MSESRSKVDTDDLKDTFLECPVCVQHFNLYDRRPRLLRSCLHAFCTQCLQYLLNKEGQGQITCPLCRKVEKVPRKAEALPADPVRSNLVEYLQVTQQKGIQCTDCPDGFEATFRCQPCRTYLCNECNTAHMRVRVTRDHRVISLNELFHDTTDNLERLHFCKVHPKHELEFYCTTDDKLCCVSCTFVDHSGHKFQKIESAAVIKKQEFDNNLERLQSIGETIEKRNGENEVFLTTLKTEIDKSESNVNAMFDALKTYAEKRRAELLKQVREKNEYSLLLLQKQIDADKDTLARVDSTVLYCKQTKTRTDDVELCLMHDSISRNIGSIGDDAKSPECILGFRFVPDNGSKLQNFISSLGECIPRRRKLPDGLNKEVKIVLIGENGPHKILVGNALLRQQSFSMESLSQSSGSTLKEQSEIDGHTIVVDIGYNASGMGRPSENHMNTHGFGYISQQQVHLTQFNQYDAHLLVILVRADPPMDNYQPFLTAIQNCQQQLDKLIIVFVTRFLNASLIRSCNIEDYIGHSEQLKSLVKQVGNRYVVLDSGASAETQTTFLYDVMERVNRHNAPGRTA